MNQTNSRTIGKIGLVLFPALLVALTGCVGYGDEPGHADVTPPQAYVEPVVTSQDDYVYFPDYEIYYSSNRRMYTYQEGGSWISRPAPPHMAVSTLFATPSVRMNFHDSPSSHHAAVARQFPKHGSLSPQSQAHNDDHGK